MFTTGLMLAALSINISSYGINEHPYDIALKYCRDKGGLAKYIDNGDSVEFSCANNLSDTIYIFRD